MAQLTAPDVFEEQTELNPDATDLLTEDTIDDLWYPSNVEWITLNDDDFLNRWQFTETNDSAYSETQADDASRATADGMSLYFDVSNSYNDTMGAPVYMRNYVPMTGMNISEPGFFIHTIDEDTSTVLTITLDSTETAALQTAYTIETNLATEMETTIKDFATRISLMTIDVAHTFKKISPPKLIDSLSAFESGEQESSESVIISTTYTGY
jgi:hypothetical protein